MEAKALKIVYMGTPDFAVAPLRALIEGGYNVVGVVTVPDKQSGRGQKLSQSAVKQYVASLGDAECKNDGENQCAPKDLKKQPTLLQPDKLRDEQWLDELRSLDADLFIVVAFRMLPEVVWQMPPLGTFNLHASLLPLYRGAAPINWAIINGDTQSGVTTFFLNELIDKGAVIDQRAVDIAASDSAGDLHDKLMDIGVELVLSSVDKIAKGAIEPRVQVEPTDSKRALAPKIFRDFCKIDWGGNAIDIHNKIRGLSPYPAAWSELDNGLMVKILASHVELFSDAENSAENSGQAPIGALKTDNKTYLKIACADGWVYIDTIHPAGKRSMAIADFLRGTVRMTVLL